MDPLLVEITLDFNTTSKYYVNNSRLAEKLARDLRGLREPACDICIKGLDIENTQLLLENSDLPAWSEEGSPQEAKRIKSQGDAFQKQGRYIDARSTYIIAFLMMSHWALGNAASHDYENFAKVATLACTWMAVAESLKALGHCSIKSCVHEPSPWVEIPKDEGKSCWKCRHELRLGEYQAKLAKKLMQDFCHPEPYQDPEHSQEVVEAYVEYCQNSIEHGDLKEARSILQIRHA